MNAKEARAIAESKKFAVPEVEKTFLNNVIAEAANEEKFILVVPICHFENISSVGHYLRNNGFRVSKTNFDTEKQEYMDIEITW